ncbi:MAG: hypothetical protein AAGC44_06280 [Planctomycetota bacterium]
MRPWIHLTFLLFLAGLTTLVLAQDGRTSSASGPDRRPNAWQPDTTGRERFRPIVDLNIFRADRTELNRTPGAAPPEVETGTPEPTVDPTPTRSTNPDHRYVLRGITLRGQQGYAFIEDLETGQTQKVAVPGDFARGRLSDATLDGLTYRPADGAEEVRLGTGYTLTGELAPRGTSIARNPVGSPDTDDASAAESPDNSASGGPASPDTDDGLSELERRLRERRLRGE